MSELFWLLATMGLAFGLMARKVDFLLLLPRRVLGDAWVDEALQCPFCTGFHAGWMLHLVRAFLCQDTPWFLFIPWGFAGAIGTYVLLTILEGSHADR